MRVNSRFFAAGAITIAVVGLLAADHLYFKDMRADYDGGAISEGFIRKGMLGKLLREGGYLGLSADSGKMVSDDLCATDEVLKGFDRHDLFRLRFSLHSSVIQDVNVTLYSGTDKQSVLFDQRVPVYPREESYHLYFNAEREEPLALRFSTSTRLTDPVFLGELAIDGQYGRTQPLLEEGEVLLGTFSDNARVGLSMMNGGFRGIALDRPAMIIHYTLPGGVTPEMYSGVFPGKKNQGFCRYAAVTQSGSRKQPISELVPEVRIEMAPEYLSGDQGILSNRESKGRAWEVPAQVVIDNGEDAFRQSVGLRSHGGTKGRTKDYDSFRIYSRRAYGQRGLRADLLFENPGRADLHTLVLKYTYQVFGSHREEFNPFIHALALDVADHVGALVPRHGLVDLHVNDESRGLYLAMEHLSRRTVRRWLGRDNFRVYNYKKYNPQDEQEMFYLLLAQITSKQGEAALEALAHFYDIDNVINSIVLSAYIADDDYCQGLEIIDNIEDLPNATITSINWDLDHGFLKYEKSKFWITADRPAFWLIKPAVKTTCARKWAYSWVFSQSPTFRRMLRDRLEELFDDRLSPEGMAPLLDYYREVNLRYYGGRHDEAIRLLEDFIEQRPAVMRKLLDQLESEVQDKAEKDST